MKKFLLLFILFMTSFILITDQYGVRTNIIEFTRHVFSTQPEEMADAYDHNPVYSPAYEKYVVLTPTAGWADILYGKKDFAYLEKTLSDLLKEPNDFLRIQYVYDVIVKSSDNSVYSSEHKLKTLNEWIEKNPGNELAHLYRGDFYISYAFEIRGQGFSKTVKSEAWDFYEERLSLAKKDLLIAYEINPHNPVTVERLINLLGRVKRDKEGTSEKDAMQFYSNFVKEYPHNPLVTGAMLEFHDPGWGGDIAKFDAMEAEIIDALRNEPYLVFALLRAHTTSSHGKYEYYFSNPTIWKTLSNSFSLFLAAHPNNMLAHVQYAYLAYVSQQYEIAAEQFTAAGPYFYPDSLWWKDLNYYNKARIYSLNLVTWQHLKDCKLDKAVPLLQESINWNPSDTWALVKLSEIHYLSGDKKKAKEYAQKALENRAVGLDGAAAKNVLAENVPKYCP